MAVDAWTAAAPFHGRARDPQQPARQACFRRRAGRSRCRTLHRVVASTGEEWLAGLTNRSWYRRSQRHIRIAHRFRHACSRRVGRRIRDTGTVTVVATREDPATAAATLATRAVGVGAAARRTVLQLRG